MLCVSASPEIRRARLEARGVSPETAAWLDSWQWSDADKQKARITSYNVCYTKLLRGVSLDAADGRLKTKGWVADAGLTVDDVLPRLEAAGVPFIIYTDISRDGMHAGVNLAAMERLCASTRIPVIAAGGVTNLDDLKKLWPLSNRGLEGVITGRAIYEGTLDFRAAMDFIAAQE